MLTLTRFDQDVKAANNRDPKIDKKVTGSEIQGHLFLFTHSA
jgi:hypothetical protein